MAKTSSVSTAKQRLLDRRRRLLKRRPHRTFRLTSRRDYVRSLELPGYVALTAEVLRVLHSHARTLWWLVGVFTLLAITLGGIVSQTTYSNLSDVLSGVSNQVFGGQVNQVGQASMIVLALLLNPTESLSDVQRLLLGLLMIWLWLVVVWLLRQWLQARRPRLRDAIYSAGAPLAASLCLALLLIVQLLPVGIVALVYQALASTGMISEGFGMMITGLLLAGSATLSLYWAASTLIALVIVTLPGTYPMQAVRAAGDLVIGRRLRIMLRLLWCLAIVAATWAVVLVPIVLLDSWAKTQWGWLRPWPLVPYLTMVMIALTGIWMASYMYILYRKVVDYDARA